VLRPVYSNRAEALLADLALKVRAQQARDGALVPVRVVVPSAAVEQYLRVGIARTCGIAANVQTSIMTRFACETVAQATQLRVAGADAFEAMALTLLLDDAFVADPELAPVRAYLAAGKSREAAEVRRVQLAARIGRLFEEYTYARSEMLVAWPRGETLGERHAEAERWQRRMWLAMFAEGGVGRARGLVPLHEALLALPAPPRASVVTSPATPPATLLATPAPAQALARALHVFGFAHFARAFHDLFARLARASDVFVYTLSPCEGFWEDFDPHDPAPLQLWGRPGREHVRALNAVAGFDHDDRFAEPQGSSLLAQVQRDLYHREPSREGAEARPGPEADESLLVVEHASVRRELEAVASEIWRLLERDGTLRFGDIAVLLPDADVGVYLAHLPAVFREALEIPHRHVDVPDGTAGGEDGVTEAVDLLLGLALGRFTRQEVLRVALHPAVVASIDGVDPGRWLAWCDALGVVHGADRADHEDTYIDRDILNWDQALRRLALGTFMAGDASGERRPFEAGGEAYVPHEVAASEMRDAAALGLLVRSLVADARFVRSAELLPGEWSDLLCTLVETYVAPVRDGDAEELARCLRSLHGLGSFDLGGRRVSCRTALELARARIASPDRGRGTEGVVVSRLGSLRPVPSRVVFACGMGEGRFPTADAEDPLDLRWARRIERDVTARERDKYAFLEVLLGARDRLYLSYVSRDPLTGDALAPSSVVQDLVHALARSYALAPSTLTRLHPLRRYSPAYFPELFPGAGRPGDLGTMCLPEARAEARTLAMRRGARSHGLAVSRGLVEARAASDPDWAALSEHLRIVALPETSRPTEGRVAVSMYALVKFLEFPLQGWARFRVGLDEVEEDDALAREDEPFETGARDETLLLRGVFFAAAAKGSMAEAYDDVVRERELRGTGPTGIFAHGERTEHLAALDAWSGRLAEHRVSPGAIEVHRFGRAGEHARADHAHPPLVVEVDVPDAAGVTRIARVEIGGRTLPVGRISAPGVRAEAGGASPARAPCGVSITLSRRAKESQNDWTRADRQRAVLRAFVDHAVLSASGVADGRAHASLVVVAAPGGAHAERISFAPLSRSEATVWLRGLVRDLLTGSHTYFLPAEAVLVWRGRRRQGPLVTWLEVARDLLDGDGPPALRSAYGPVPRPHDYPIPGEDAARAMVATRFGALFDAWEAAS
jgi:exodeoxyribonuclease V gamma subunit